MTHEESRKHVLKGTVETVGLNKRRLRGDVVRWGPDSFTMPAVRGLEEMALR